MIRLTGSKLRVVEIDEFEGGRVRLQVLAPGGLTELVLFPADARKIADELRAAADDAAAAR